MYNQTAVLQFVKGMTLECGTDWFVLFLVLTPPEITDVGIDSFYRNHNR